MAVESTTRADERELQPAAAEFREDAMWRALKTVRDPEIPVNIVDLGLIYSAVVVPVEGGKRIEVQMTLTAPGCGMSEVLKKDVETKLARLPEVREVKVEVVFDPPWTPAKMSEDAKLALGFDSTFGAPAPSQSTFKIMR
jgi:metal-sulfur cluster biosynthetic enzyme